jgi:NAD(P)-dependent dehydrogenase (short-subunit alcohol dehydrogenase family)
MLDGRVAVVTGAGRGLGRSYAKALAAAGASVVVNDLDADVADETVKSIVGAGGSAVAEVGAVGGSEMADALVARAVAEFGRLDVMITNAGALRDRTLRNTTDEDFDLVVTSHLRGTFTCGRAAVVRFRDQGEGGRLILVGSPAGMVATIPGLGELVEKVDRGEPVPEPLRRQGLGTPDDVAPVIVYLASAHSSGVTGQAIAAGGDRIALWTHPTQVAEQFRAGGWTADDVRDLFAGPLKDGLQDFMPPPLDPGGE